MKEKTSSSDLLKNETRTLSPKLEVLRVRLLAETAVLVALSGALYSVKIFNLPQGGSVTLASMVPVLMLALRRGPRVGIIGGVVFGLVALVEDASTGIYYPAQVVLDYPLAFGSLGISGFFRPSKVRPAGDSNWRSIYQTMIGVVVAIAARFTSHFMSGILFFASLAPAGMSPLVYSALYNGSFLLPELAITAVIVVGLVRFKVLELYL